MWKSIKLLFKGLIQSVFFYLSLSSLIFEILIKPYMPENYQRIWSMPMYIGFILFFIMFFIAVINVYHKLRMTKRDELYKVLPEANKDRILRIFYDLCRKGKSLKGSNIDRKQEWDENVIMAIKEHCAKQFLRIYLLDTDRPMDGKIPSLEERYYDDALSSLKYFIDNNFDQFVKG